MKDDWDEEGEVVAVAPLFAPSTTDPLEELRYARNGYRSAVASAEGFVSGRRVLTLREEKRRYEQALWDAREEIDALIRERLS